MFTSKLLARASAVTLLGFFLSACGGGGGGGSGGSSDNGGPGDPRAVIDRNNARHLADGHSQMLSVASDAVYYAPQLIANLVDIALSAGTPSFDQKFPCATSGTVKTSGSVNAAGTGTITLEYDNCTEWAAYSYRYNGSLRISIRAASNGYPTAYDYHYDNYRFEIVELGMINSYSGDFSVDPQAGGIRFAASMTLTDGPNTVKSTNYVAIVPNSQSAPIPIGGRLSQAPWGDVDISNDNAYVYLTGKQGRLRIDHNFSTSTRPT